MYLFRTRPTGIRRILRWATDAGDESPRFPVAEWRHRHRIAVSVVWVHPFLIVGAATWLGYGVFHGVLEALPVAVAALMASVSLQGRDEAAGWTALGLFASSITLVHLFSGSPWLHLHFVFAVAFLAVYMNWTTLVLGGLTVVAQHAVIGILDPHSVYGHEDPSTIAPILVLVQLGAVATLMGRILVRSRRLHPHGAGRSCGVT